MQTTGSDAGQAEGTNIMKDEKKDFEMKNDAGTDMTEEMPRPEEGAATDGTAKVRVRPKGKAAKVIIDYLDASDEALPDDIGQFEVNDAVTKAVDALYDRYAAEGIVPTREGFAGCCEEPTIGKTVLAMPEDPFARKAMSRKAVAAICAGLRGLRSCCSRAAWSGRSALPRQHRSLLPRPRHPQRRRRRPSCSTSA